MQNILKNKFVLILLPGLLFWLAWEPIGIWFLSFFALVPLFYFTKIWQEKNKKYYFLFIYISLLNWNVLCTWWVANSTIGGAITMLLANTLIMCIPFLLYKYSLKKYTQHVAIFVFIVSWITYEFIHHRWDISWPWLSFGNVFSSAPYFIQWYEHTGILGGSIVLIFINYLFYYVLISKKIKLLIAPLSIIMITFLASYLCEFYFSAIHTKEPSEIEVLSIQPNYDAYTEKFTLSNEFMLTDMLHLCEKNISKNTRLILFPETALQETIDVKNPQSNAQIQIIQNFCKKYKVQFIAGADMQQVYMGKYRPSSTARKSQNIWWDIYNSAVFVDSNMVQFIHKSKLVPGTEKMPLASVFPWINNLALSVDENSISGSLGVSDSNYTLGTKIKIAPAICYESIYGEFIGKYCAQGATFIAVITNDDWWGNTAGYKQHCAYSKLRAIEHRRWVARSANTGISCFINPYGKLVGNKTSYKQKAVVKQTIQLISYVTFYSKHGDFLGRISCFVLVIVVLFQIIKIGFKK